jgi:hypothetical protein
MNAPLRRAALAAAALASAACQPEARRMLLLDLTLADPIEADAAARPWRDAGYAVEYRRFYPHLTRDDLTRYHGVILLGGREPEAPSDALTAGDVAVLTEWVTRGGVIALGFPTEGEGGLDRWTMNRWLSGIGSGVAIGDRLLHDSAAVPGGAADPQPWIEPIRGTALQIPDADPIPAGGVHALRVAAPTQALARASRSAYVRAGVRAGAPRHGAAVIAASRVGGGLVIVASRGTLEALGPTAEPGSVPPLALEQFGATETFLETVARWTRRPAEWASIPPARPGSHLSLEGGGRTLVPRPPRVAPPSGAEVGGRTGGRAAPASRSRTTPEWIGKQGVRVLWAPLPGPSVPYESRVRSLDSLPGLIDLGAFIAVAGSAGLEAMAESTRYAPWERTVVQTTWKLATDRLEQTGARWLPVIEPELFRLPPDTGARGVRGEPASSGCLLDPAYWSGALVPAARAAARLAAAHRDLIPALVINLGSTSSTTRRFDAYCDADYHTGLDRLVRTGLVDTARAARLGVLPPASRYDTLLEGGLLAAYDAALEDAVTDRAAALRADVQRIRPGLGFALRADAAPTDWFGMGLLRGLSQPAAPVVLFSREVRMRSVVDRYRERGADVIAVLELVPARLPPGGWSRLRRAVFEENDGFWLGGAAALAGGAGSGDSVGRQIRRMIK